MMLSPNALIYFNISAFAEVNTSTHNSDSTTSRFTSLTRSRGDVTKRSRAVVIRTDVSVASVLSFIE
jgi:hypothetical protein